MLTKQDLSAISQLMDTKLDEKLDQKLDEKLKPIHKKLNKIQLDLKDATNFLDKELMSQRKRIKRLEDHSGFIATT